MLTVTEARRKGVCRVCGKPDVPRQITPTLIDSFVYDYGKEYAHASCIARPMTEVWAGFPSLVIDEVTQDGIKLKPLANTEDN